MRRRTYVFGMAAMIAANVWIGPGAKAAEVDSCQLGTLPEGTFVTIEPGQVNVYPGNVAPYAGAVAGVVTDYVSCLRAQNQRWIDCVVGVVENRPTVTIDPETLQITIDTSNFPPPC